jgi:hypothetical protein
MRKLLLECGVGAAILYFASLIIASLTWPGYSHVTQYASELGSAAAPYPMIFNYGIMAGGLLGILGGLGVALHFANDGRWLSGLLAGLALSAWGASMVFGGYYPMPNPLHNGYGLALAAPLLPLFLMLALRGRAGAGMFAFLAVWFLATAGLLAVMFGVGELVTRANVGLWQRSFAVALIGGIGVACSLLARRASAHAGS